MLVFFLSTILSVVILQSLLFTSIVYYMFPSTSQMLPHDFVTAEIATFVIDPQIDFHPGGTLAVAGADDDAIRARSFIEISSPFIKEIFVSLDTHSMNHIAHDPTLLKHSDGSTVNPFSQVTLDDLDDGKISVRPDIKDHFQSYLSNLAKAGKYQYTYWPPHCIEGTVGHSIEPNILTGLEYWSKCSDKKVHYIRKGRNDMTEMYSALKAEVPQDDDPSTQLNMELINSLNRFDYVLIFGQAKSHCVKSTIEDYLDYISPKTKIILLNDLTSSVTGFDHLGNNLEKLLLSKGHYVMSSTDLVFN